MKKKNNNYIGVVNPKAPAPEQHEQTLCRYDLGADIEAVFYRSGTNTVKMEILKRGSVEHSFPLNMTPDDLDAMQAAAEDYKAYGI